MSVLIVYILALLSSTGGVTNISSTVPSTQQAIATEQATIITAYDILNVTAWVVNDLYVPYFQAACAVSMFSSLVIISTYIFFKDLRTTSRLLLVFLSFMDFGTALSNSIGMAVGFTETTRGCQVQAAFAIFCGLSSYFWTASIALYLYFTIVREGQFVAEKMVKVFPFVVWGLPLIIVVVAGALGVLGFAVTDTRTSIAKHLREKSVSLTGGWCYIRSDRNSSELASQSLEWYSPAWFDFWVMMAGVAWQIATFFFCAIVYILIRIHILKEKNQSKMFVTRESLKIVDSVDRKLTFIPVVFFLLSVFAVVRAFGRIARDDDIIYNEPLIVLQGICDSSQGTVNCVIFCLFTKAVWNRITARVRSCFSFSGEHFRRERGVSVNHPRQVVTYRYSKEPRLDRKTNGDRSSHQYSDNSEITPILRDSK